MNRTRRPNCSLKVGRAYTYGTWMIFGFLKVILEVKSSLITLEEVIIDDVSHWMYFASDQLTILGLLSLVLWMLCRSITLRMISVHCIAMSKMKSLCYYVSMYVWVCVSPANNKTKLNFLIMQNIFFLACQIQWQPFEEKLKRNFWKWIRWETWQLYNCFQIFRRQRYISKSKFVMYAVTEYYLVKEYFPFLLLILIWNLSHWEHVISKLAIAVLKSYWTFLRPV